jgi:succinoglycan biosynthesis transport protein ExoP
MSPMTQVPPPAPAPDGEADRIDLLQYVRTILKRKWIILAVMSLGITAGVIYTMRQVKIYQATASVVVNPMAPQVFGHEVQDVVQLGAGNFWGNIEYYNTQTQILMSYDLAEETVRRHSLHTNVALVAPGVADDLDEKGRINYATRMLYKSLHARLADESRIVHLTVRHPNPELASELANKHVETYIANNLQQRSTGTDSASKILSSELDIAEKRVRESEQKLYDFKKSNGILSFSLEDKMSQLAADLQRYSAAVSDARIKRIDMANTLRLARQAVNGNVLESPVFALVGDTSAESLKASLIAEQQGLTNLSQQLGPKNPEFVAQKKRVDDLIGALEREARLAVTEIEQRHKNAIDTERELNGEVERLTREAFELGPKTIEYNRLKRQAHADEENYNLVLTRLRTSELSGRNDLGNIQWHTRARPTYMPVHPRMKVNIALAAVLSLILGLAIAFLLEFMDRSVKSAADVEQIMKAPVLGLVPMVAEVANGATPELIRERDLYIFQHPTSRVAESVRSIRTNILFSSADRELKVLTITSPNPREGKTTCVIYLGTTMAQSGQRVLLIDTDMRRPRLHASMGVSRDRGLSNLILGDSSYEDAIKTTDVPNLYVLPCGPTPPNPAELLLTQRFQQIMGELGDRFDRIILDSPPLQAVADAAVLGRMSDGVILVAKSGKTNRDELIRSARQLRDVQAALVGVVINSLDLSSKTYGYYNYAYGYGSYGEKQPATEGDA